MKLDSSSSNKFLLLVTVPTVILASDSAIYRQDWTTTEVWQHNGLKIRGRFCFHWAGFLSKVPSNFFRVLLKCDKMCTLKFVQDLHMLDNDHAIFVDENGFTYMKFCCDPLYQYKGNVGLVAFDHSTSTIYWTNDGSNVVNFVFCWNIYAFKIVAQFVNVSYTWTSHIYICNDLNLLFRNVVSCRP